MGWSYKKTRRQPIPYIVLAYDGWSDTHAPPFGGGGEPETEPAPPSPQEVKAALRAMAG